MLSSAHSLPKCCEREGRWEVFCFGPKSPPKDNAILHGNPISPPEKRCALLMKGCVLAESNVVRLANQQIG